MGGDGRWQRSRSGKPSHGLDARGNGVFWSPRRLCCDAHPPRCTLLPTHVADSPASTMKSATSAREIEPHASLAATRGAHPGHVIALPPPSTDSVTGGTFG